MDAPFPAHASTASRTDQLWYSGAAVGGRYRLAVKICAGAMGEVWRADHVSLGMPVVLGALAAGPGWGLRDGPSRVDAAAAPIVAAATIAIVTTRPSSQALVVAPSATSAAAAPRLAASTPPVGASVKKAPRGPTPAPRSGEPDFGF